MRILDLFCNAGGAAVGYHRAFPDSVVVGVDIEPQPRFPFVFLRADAMEVLANVAYLRSFDFIHASPPCQSKSLVSRFHAGTQEKYPNLIAPVRDALTVAGVPFVIENVPGSDVRKDLLLCGEMFGLRVHRHRYFEVEGFLVMRRPHAPHALKGALTNCHIEEGYTRWVTGHYANHSDASAAMGIDWMNRDELRDAIPPAYSQFIGEQFAASLVVSG